MNENQQRAYAKQVAKRYGLRGEDAEDAAQSAVIACWECGSKDVKYLKGTIFNSVKVWIRDKDPQTRGQVYLEDALHPPVGLERNHSDNDNREAMCNIARGDDTTSLEVSEFLGTLNHTERTVVALRMQDESLEEIGKAVGLSGQGVADTLKRLQKLLGEYLG